ncbi:T9SS-dependent choice-of-anchor J family protein [Echinicola vietnamensis]|uniref:Pregnancy-associated plasma protein-A n=1 Tax=Echinicola vietnamensis (strain DSM 17526 / LMG 23754 / KMM 6221) TaxID=926556 RepID=L0G3P0_ECHVK|nr:choice-of-anchor J domain-containing protein [Echinicola vietnamensis]AGA79601.1 Pregnancy-associated plasma protein-A [Echinicola vietnamensis DSM 17526]
MKRIILILRIGLVLSFLLFINSATLFAQQLLTPSLNTSSQVPLEKCTAPLMEQKQMEALGIFGSKEYFEAWMEDKIQDRKSANLRTTMDEVRLIPVVVHVIHNGEPLGQGANIPLEQIEAQIRILNEDYNRTNPDAANTLTAFQPVAANANIQFVLAKQDPRGLPTNGIVRVQGSQSEYDQSDAPRLSQLSYWNSEEYLNIWVAPLTSINLGYATFPLSDLDGLNFPPTAKETDGVTIDYEYFGEGGSAINASQGRTTTHEIGHFLGLRHIWGDGGCDVDDFVNDTPDQNGPNSNCQTDRATCGNLDMIQNYMDYTPDACMNLFTQGQLERMNVVLANSPRRVSLINNRATQDPQIFAHDLAIETVIDPKDYICSTTITPQISVYNAGTNSLTSAEVAIRLNGQVLEQKSFSLDLDQGDADTLSFASIQVAPSGNNFVAEIVSVNGGADENSTNNTRATSPVIQPNLSLPYTYSSGDFNSVWTVKNEDEALTWETQPLTLDGQSVEALRLNFYNYETSGATDYLISPQINLAQFPDAQLVFDMAYARYPQTGLDDQLIIGISTDCGNTFDFINPPYQKSQERLETATASTAEFIPSSQRNFRTEVVDLSPYADEGNIRIAFITINGFGNNLYLKDIRLNPNQATNYSYTLDELASPSPLPDGSQENDVIHLTNTGQLAINTLLVDRVLNGFAQSLLTLEDMDIAPGEQVALELPSLLRDELNGVEYRFHSPNYDQNASNLQELERYFYQDAATVAVPWRQYFDNLPELDPWVTVNPENGQTAWEVVTKDGGQNDNLAVLQTQTNGNTYWLGSPLMDLSNTSRASIFFDRAASGITGNTRLKVMLSLDGGNTFGQQVAIYEGETLNTITGDSPVNPNTPNEFVKEFVDLSEFTGDGSEKVRIAFVLENGTENTQPIYLDNIELFLSDNPNPVYPSDGDAVLYPNPATSIFNLAFNLPQREDVRIQIVSTSGQVAHDVVYPGTLNQTYSFSSELFAKGIFIIKIQSETLSLTKRLIIR